MTVSAPSASQLAFEPFRGALAQVLGALNASRLAREVTPGAGAPVLVIPGLGATSHATRTLRDFLGMAGYHAYDWGMGLNTGPRGGIEAWMVGIEARLRYVYEAHGRQKVKVVGWSLGGLYARELAKRCPELIERVVTVGTPLTGDPDATNGKMLYRVLCGTSAHDDADLLERIKVAPKVPCTSLYSRLDGVVAWEACVNDPQGKTRSFELHGVSHLAMMSEPRSLVAIAAVLAGEDPTVAATRPARPEQVAEPC